MAKREVRWTPLDEEIWAAYRVRRRPIDEVAHAFAITPQQVHKACARHVEHRRSRIDEEHEELFQEAIELLRENLQWCRDGIVGSLHPQVTTTSGRAELSRNGDLVQLPDLVEVKTRTAPDAAFIGHHRRTAEVFVETTGVRRPPESARSGQDGSGLQSNTEDLYKGLARQLATAEEEAVVAEAAAGERDRQEAEDLRLALLGAAEPA